MTGCFQIAKSNASFQSCRSEAARASSASPAPCLSLFLCLSQDLVFVTVHDDQSERMQWSNMWACVCPKFFPSDPPPPPFPLPPAC